LRVFATRNPFKKSNYSVKKSKNGTIFIFCSRLLTNARLGLIAFPRTNTLVYFVVATVTKQKGFMTMISFRYYWLTVFVSKRLAGKKREKKL